MLYIDNNDPNQSTYIEKCIKSSVAEISNLNLDTINQLLMVSKQCYADILSDISAITKITYFVIDNYAALNTQLLASLIQNEKLSFVKESFSNTNIAYMQNIIKTFTDSLNTAQEDITAMYNLEDNSLNIYNNNDIQGGINFKQAEQTSSLLFKYHEGKKTLKTTVSIMEAYTELKDIFDNNKKSLSILTIDKANDTLLYFSSAIKALSEQLNSIEFIIDSSTLANTAYNKYLLTNDKYYNSFLSRNYDKIREDIIKCYFNS